MVEDLGSVTALQESLTGTLETAITDAAAVFAERVIAASSVTAVELAHAEFLGSRAVQCARAAVGDGEVFRGLTAAARLGLERFYETCGTARHALARPYGYPGDFAILELVYDRRPHASSRTAAGRFADVWFTGAPLARAVSARKDLLANVFEERVAVTERPLRILSLAAGAARELREMSPRALQFVESTLVDRDPRPLEFARISLGAVAPSHRVRTVVGDVITGGDVVAEVGEDGPFDIIYSFGLFDYLADEPLLQTVRNFLPLLAEGGQVVFCLKDCRHYDWLPADWLYNWRFVPRTADDGVRLARELDLQVSKTWMVGDRCIAVWACERR